MITTVLRSIDAAGLAALCEDRNVTLDVTNLDLARLPPEVKAGIVSYATSFNAPLLVKAGYIGAYGATSFETPLLQSADETIDVTKATNLTLPQLTKAVSIIAPEARDFSAPYLVSAQYIYLPKADYFSIPRLRMVREVFAPEALVLRDPHLRVADITARSLASVYAPHLDAGYSFHPSDSSLLKPVALQLPRAVPNAEDQDFMRTEVRVSNSTGRLELEELCRNSQLMLDVTDLDLTRLPAEVTAGMFSHATSFNAPLLKSAGYIGSYSASRFEVPQLSTASTIFARIAPIFYVPKLEIAGDIHADGATRVEAPVLRSAGSIHAGKATSVIAPQLVTVTALHASLATVVILPEKGPNISGAYAPHGSSVPARPEQERPAPTPADRAPS